MKILVPVKWVVDYNVRIRVRDDGSGVELNNVKMAMNPFDEISVEEAIRLKEAGHASEIIVVTLGDTDCQGALRNALAMGADRAIHVVSERQIEPLAVAKILQQIVVHEKPQIVMLGKQAIDDDCNQTAQMLSALLKWPQATFANTVKFDKGELSVTREVDSGLQVIVTKLPAIISTDLRLNEPRYASLPNIMKARRKPIEQKNATDYGFDVKPRLKIINTIEPPKRKTGVIVKSVSELVDKLRNEAGVIS